MKFNSLPAQVAEHIKQQIVEGRWVEWLPGERSLAESLQISRRTLTAAVAQLNKEGVLRSEAGRGSRILKEAGTKASATSAKLVGLLTPEPLDVMRPGTILWVNDLRAILAEEGCLLTSFQGHKYFSKRPGNALKRLIAGNPQSCWVVAQTTLETQRWLDEHAIPSVIAGTRHVGVNLPDVDVDTHALCYHAASMLLRLGHRKIALLLTESPGYVASEHDAEAGFRAAFAHNGDSVPIVTYHQRSQPHLVRVLSRMFNGADFPTAVIATHGMDYLTVTSFLAQRGLRVPEQVSVVARNDDAFLDALLPAPTRYGGDPHLYAGKLFKMITHLMRGTATGQRHLRIEPLFIKGASIARPTGID